MFSTNLPDMDWQEFGKLGGIDSSGTIFALLDWLSQQEHYSSGDLFHPARLSLRGIDELTRRITAISLSRLSFLIRWLMPRALARATADDEAVQT